MIAHHCNECNVYGKLHRFNEKADILYFFRVGAAGKPGNLDNITVKIADLGSSCWVVRHIQ